MSNRDSRDRLLYRFLDQRTNSRDVFHQVRGDAVPLLKIIWTVVGDPDFPSASSQTNAFSGRSMAKVGEAIIKGVPAVGLPKIRSCVGLIFSPAFFASPPWSTKAKTLSPREVISDSEVFSESLERNANWKRE